MTKTNITQRSSVTQSYFTDIYKIPLLKDEEMEKMSDLILKRNQEALDLLVVSNLRYAIHEAKKYQGLGLGLDDLINEANLGLIRAAKKFDPTTGFRFISYAVWWIKQGILTALCEHGKIVRFPQNVINCKNKISKGYGELEQILERSPSEAEIADYLCFTKGQILNARNARTYKMELDSPMRSKDGGDNVTYLDITPNDDADLPDAVFTVENLKDDLARKLSVLPPREVKILKMCYGIDQNDEMTLEEVGSRMGLTRERVRQLRNKALNTVRVSIK